MIHIINAHKETGALPVFSWKLKGDEKQLSYRIQIYGRKNRQVWDSGEVFSCQRHNIFCQMTPEKNECYHWKLTVKGDKGTTQEYSGKNFLSGIAEWKNKWAEPGRERMPLTDSTEPISPEGRTVRPENHLNTLDPSIYMRKVVTLDEIPEFAVAHATAHGIYALYINSQCVSDLFAPGYTSYDKHLEYQSYDITSCLKQGENVIGVILADGWYTGKIGAMGIGQQYGKESAFLLQVHCKYADGKESSFGTDGEMRWNEGALRYADLYVGEYFDSTKELKGWLNPGYDDSAWEKVRICNYGYYNLTMQGIPAVQELRQIHPRILHAPNGDILLDAEENIAGYVEFSLELKQGDIVSLEHSETVDQEGNYLQNIIGQNKDQTDYFVCGQDGKTVYKPQFTFHGFRYVRVKGVDHCSGENFVIHVIGTSLEKTGEFMCSDTRLNKLHENILRSQEGNMICIPTDCPQRERTGWTGDVQLYTPTGCYEQNIEHFLRHWLIDMRHEQLPDGQIPHIVPCMKSHDVMKPPGIEGVSSAGWSDAAVIVPWRLYEAYGDINILRENFDMMLKYMEATEKMACELPPDAKKMSEDERNRQHYLWNTGFQYGDWLMPSIQMSGRPIFEVVQQTGYVVATLQYAMVTEMMAEICQVLGREELEEHYRRLNEKIRKAWAEEYMEEDGTFKKDYQGVYVLALETGAVPKEHREKALDRLVEKIHENGDLLDTGFLSVPYLLPVLQKNGREDIAHMLLFQEQCPSWLYEVKMGATTMWEYWNGYAPDGTPGDCSMNHFAFGCVGEYLYKSILGISPASPGYKKVCIHPDLNCGLAYASGSYNSIWGKIAVSWRIEGKEAVMEVILPPDVEAEIYFGTEKINMQTEQKVYRITLI